MHRLLKVNLILVVLSLFFLRLNCFALPEVETIVEGSATFSNPDSNTLEINAIDKTIINYQSFDIKNNESVIISLPSVDSQILNRVLGDKASKILGSLYCNGILILINSNGIYFGPNSNVDAAGLIASTRDITNSNFLSSKYIFEKLSPEQLDMLLVNQGKIDIKEGGFGVLIAGAIENSGIISAPVGTIAFAAGDMVTLDISTDGLISIAIDKPTAAKVYDLDGNPITSQIKNTGTLQADDGVVLLKAESLPGLFEHAINLEGYVKANKTNIKDGKVEIVSSGDVLINGRVEADKISIGKLGEVGVKTIEMPTGVLLSNLTEVYKTGDIRLTSSYIQDNLITLEGEGFKVTYLANSNLTLQADNAINTTPGLIIQANQLKLIAKQFGSLEVPLTLSASLTYIYRLSGNIDILESLGLGTSIMLRGPPASGFGAIIYSKDTQLILESPSGSLSLSSAVTLIAKNLALISLQGIYSYANLVADETITLKSQGPIISYGSLKTPLLIEEGASFSIGGTYQVGYAYLRNLDNVVTLETGDYSGETADIDNIIINDNAIINLIGNTLFRADSDQDGVGSFTMNTGSSIVGNGYDLSIYASESSTLRSITGVGTLYLAESKPGSNPTYTAYNDLSLTHFSLNNATFEAGSITLTVSGNWTNQGTFNAGSSTVIFIDATQTSTVLGNNTFYNFTSTTPTKELYFDKDSTQTIQGIWKLQGAYAQHIKLLSTVDGLQWKVDPQGTIDLSYIYFKDSYNISPTEIVPIESTNRGNCVNWDPTATWDNSDADGLWSNANNWTGLGGGQTPGSGDDVVFDGTSNTNCSVNVTATVASLSLSPGYSSTVSVATNIALDINGNVSISSPGGVLRFAAGATNASITVGGNWSGGTFTAVIGNTVYFDKASGTQTLRSGGSSFTNIEHSGAGTLQLVSDDLTVTSVFTNSAGTFDLNGKSWTMTSATFSNNSGTVQLKGSETITGLTTNDTSNGTWKYVGDNTAGPYTLQAFNGSSSYYNLSIADTNTTTATFRAGSALSVAGTFTISGGTYNANGNTSAVTGLTTVSGGTYSASTATQTFNGGLTISGGTFTGSTGAVDVNGNLALSSGTLTAPSGTFTVSGNWSKTGGTFTPGQNKVTFDATDTDNTLTSGSASFYNLEFNGSGGAWTLQDALDVDNNLTVTNGTLAAGTNSINIGGNFSNAGTFTTSGTTTFDATSTGKTITSGSASFYNLTFNGSGGGWTLQDALDVNNNLTITTGTLDVSSSNYQVNVAGNFSNSGTFTARSGTVVLDGSGSSNISGSNSFYNLTSTTAGKTLNFEAGTTQTITGALTFTGSSGNLIALRSQTSGTQWKIDPQGTWSISYVDVKDSNNIHATRIDPTSSTDSGNNTNWFPAATTLTSTEIEESTKSTYTIILTLTISVSEAEGTSEDMVSLASQEELVTPKAQPLDFENRFLCEDTGRGYQKCYPQGKYRTIVIVFEGRVVVSPYDEKGPQYKKAKVLTSGQSTSAESEVK